ncbi:hypothetical protein VaNZ11_004741 [Volvox africanus]|uniref:Ubiquinone biosynthesis O-methyltransferase, mitochondrial n=1 Tax=Volvox africanus TaxID=51714 RepID=A0ABQ5RYB3_9CHLO|nr:hypothetical protein VaNZ11_004741 [Volvox africanus]
MIAHVTASMFLSALQPLAVTHSGYIRNNLMALVQCVAIIARGGTGSSNSAPPVTTLPVLLPDLPAGPQRTAAPALSSPRRLPSLLPGVEDGSISSPISSISQAVASPTRTPTLPLLSSPTSCRQPCPGSHSPGPATPGLYLQARAATPPPHTSPPPLLLRRSPTRLTAFNATSTRAVTLASPRQLSTSFTTMAPIPDPNASCPDGNWGPASSDATAAAAAGGGGSGGGGGGTSATVPGGLSSGIETVGGTARGASVDPREAAKFAALAASWWRSSDGPFAPLHALNPARVRFIRQSLAVLMELDVETPEPLTGLRVLDVGCGGGILSEALARLGAEVHGIDVTKENVEVARMHARADPRVAARVRYDVISAEDLAASGVVPYDVVIASEVLEHVSRPHQLLPVLASLMAASAPAGGTSGRGGGVMIVSTLNRTPAAWAVAIAGAEYLTGMVPRGTHQWRKFITPEELSVMADSCGLHVWHAAGMVPLGPGGLSWQLSEDLSVNYIATLRRRTIGGEGEEKTGRGTSDEQDVARVRGQGLSEAAAPGYGATGNP